MDRAPRGAVIAFALIALAAAGVVKLVLWLPGATERAPARATGKAFQIPEEKRPDPAKILAETRRALEQAGTVKVHWLFFSPFEDFLPEDVRDKPRFHGYPVLGSAVVESKPASQQVLESVLGKVDPDPESLTACFEPQHGIEVKLADGRSIDLVICYHCFQMEIYDGSEEATVTIGPASQPVLNERLKAGGVQFVDRLEMVKESWRKGQGS